MEELTKPRGSSVGVTDILTEIPENPLLNVGLKSYRWSNLLTDSLNNELLNDY
jgi:hypothetical protein